MLASLRSGLNTWPARLFFMFLVALFVAWGVGSDLLRLISGTGETSAAHVGGRSIELPELQEGYRRQLAQITQVLGGRTEPSADIKRGVAEQVLGRLITQYAVTDAALGMGLVVPEEALREATFQVPAFRGPNGKFDRALFEQTLRNNNLTEARFLGLLRQDMLQRQVMEPVRAGAVSPDVLTRKVYAFQQEKRIADAVELPFSAAPTPPEPSEAQLTRWYENHKDQYSTPELRRIKAVVLSPETVAKDVQVTEQDLQGVYEQMKAGLNVPEKRSAEVVLMPDEATAKALAAQWTTGADWAAIQQEAAKQGGSPVDVSDSTRDQIPSPELAEAIFSAPAEAVLPPVQTPLGWYALKVTKVTPGSNKSFEDARDELHARVVADKAADLIYDRANKVEDLLAGGVALDNLPGDLGLAAVTGTLDAHGNTPAGQPAPIPGGDELRNALVAAAFQMKKGDPPRLTPADQQGNGGYFAVSVEDITPPTPKPEAEVAGQVKQDWIRDAIRHSQEEAAAQILAAVKGGTDLAAAAAGHEIRHLPPVNRSTPAQGVPLQLVTPLFRLKVGEPTMVETEDGFTVAMLREIQVPDANADPVGYGQVRDALARATATDFENVLAGALRERAKPRINRPVLDTLTQQSE